MPTAVKDWTGNSRSVHASNGSRHLATIDRAEQDFYATEPKATELLLQLYNFSDVWECACGAGHMAKVLYEHGILKQATDKYDHSYGDYYDFLTGQGDLFCESKQRVIKKWHGDIITNPPYKYANEFIETAMRILIRGSKLALFLPIRYLEGRERRKIFNEYPPKKIWVSSSRLICARNGCFSNAKSSAVCYAWFIWEKGFTGETALGWFN
jgi:hypothetical protein